MVNLNPDIYHKIQTARQAEAASRTITLQDVLNFYRGMTDQGVESSKDYQFIEFCNRIR